MTAKPILYILNVDEGSAASGNAFSAKAAAMAETQGAGHVIVSAAIEAELVSLPDADRKDYFDSLGLDEPGLNRVIREGYALLDLLTYFTVGPKEARAWTTAQGSTAPNAAGVIHTDFERGFIAAEIISFDDFKAYGSEQAVKEAGKMRLEGRDYLIKDGDVCHFRFNV